MAEGHIEEAHVPPEKRTTVHGRGISETVHTIITALRESGNTVDATILQEVFEGFFEGRNWTLQRFGGKEEPSTRLRSFGSGTGSKACRYLLGRDAIEINTEGIEALRGCSLTPGEIGMAFPGIPYTQHPALSVRQLYEFAGVQEAIHCLQDHHAPGLLPVPARENLLYPDSSGLDAYWRQPHKVEAVYYAGFFFQEKYGTNPFAPVEALYNTPPAQPKT